MRGTQMARPATDDIPTTNTSGGDVTNNSISEPLRGSPDLSNTRVEKKDLLELFKALPDLSNIKVEKKDLLKIFKIMADSSTQEEKPKDPEGDAKDPDDDAEDFLTRLGSLTPLASNNTGDKSTRILDEGPVTRRFILGATRLLLYQSEDHVEALASRLFDIVTQSLATLNARQEKMFDVLGLSAVSLSMVTQGCIFCTGENDKTSKLRGPDLMRHIKTHFGQNVAADTEVGDQELMDIADDAFPPGMDGETIKTPADRRKVLSRVRNFLINDLRSECQHCSEAFDFDYHWSWPGGYKTYDFTELVNTHRYWCPLTDRLGSDGYPSDLNTLNYDNITVLMPKELKYARLTKLEEEKLDMYRAYVRALAGRVSKKPDEDEDDENDEDDEYDEYDEYDKDKDDKDEVMEFGADSEPPLQDQVAVPAATWGTCEPRSSKNPPPFNIQALDTPLLVLEALGQERVYHALQKTYWSDDDLINWLADRKVKIQGCRVTRCETLKLPDDLLTHPAYSEVIRWMFPIPETVDVDEIKEIVNTERDCPTLTVKDNNGNTIKTIAKTCPILSAHFLFRYDSDKTDRLRCHSYQNLDRFWNLIGFEAYHPEDKTARTQLRRIGKEPNSEPPPLEWDKDDGSPIPGFISRCLRHLRLIGFAWEAELTYFTIGRHLTDQKSQRLQSYIEIWGRIMKWEMDIYLCTLLLHHLEAFVPDDMEPNLEYIDSLKNWSPFDPPMEGGFTHRIDQGHAQFADLQRERGLSDPFPRQPAKDQYCASLHKFKCLAKPHTISRETESGQSGDENKSEDGSKGKPFCSPLTERVTEEQELTSNSFRLLNRISGIFGRALGGGSGDGNSGKAPRKGDSRIVQFFCEPGGDDSEGLTLAQWLGVSNNELHGLGSWVYWWFPAMTRRLNDDDNVPVATPKDIETFKDKTRKHLQERYLVIVERFVGYLGLKWTGGARYPKIQSADAPKDFNMPWLSALHTDHQRISRAIISLGTLGHEHLANDLYNAVVETAKVVPRERRPTQERFDEWKIALEAIPEPSGEKMASARKRRNSSVGSDIHKRMKPISATGLRRELELKLVTGAGQDSPVSENVRSLTTTSLAASVYLEEIDVDVEDQVELGEVEDDKGGMALNVAGYKHRLLQENSSNKGGDEGGGNSKTVGSDDDEEGAGSDKERKGWNMGYNASEDGDDETDNDDDEDDGDLNDRQKDGIPSEKPMTPRGNLDVQATEHMEKEIRVFNEKE